ncbi:MAG TPA: SH3 domain-containing protein, partial [Flavisolibacter sp.]
MKYGICTVAAAPARKEPGHRNEMVNQLLFGECVEVLDQQQEWLHIRSLADDYPGWVTEHMIEEAPVDTATASCRYVASGLVNPVTLPDQLVNAPMGSFLTGYDEETRLLWDERHKYHGTFRTAGQAFDEDLLRRLIQAWLNAPYLWGGKTFMGVDCSGFV